MYSLLKERRQLQDLSLQALLIGISGFATEMFVETLVDSYHLFPESFALESLIFLTAWFSLDLLACSALRSHSFLQSLMNLKMAKRCLTTLAIAWITAIIFFKFHSFVLEFAAMLALWSLLDFGLGKLSRKLY